MSRTMSRPRSSYSEDRIRSDVYRIPGLPVFTTRSAEKRNNEISSKKYVMQNETGDALHTAWYINEKGDKVWLRFDPSRPCTFSTTETRFYKPKLHKYTKDPYAEKKIRGT
ncbi:uncharacterized protein LOC111702166 [Eurytemora carolleeae]|uniref:uncharacterized protein LOC111702166 n=1 Tax=Eurytemora carolleeae TaxID=1294199 RepID=UPI000C7933A1|nr:uncharacterized protein LOC111702166 [Eurytemora carolleeae]|eukprot:XP_023329526.1 uncharacterized protein LOC111702166 [Eurytemora affinis]